MLSKAFLVLALALATQGATVRRAPTATLSLTRHFNISGTQNLLAHDLARARHLKGSTDGDEDFVSLIQEPVNNTGVIYVAAVGVGSPPTTYNLIIDTGSSNTWVGAGTPYKPTSSSNKTDNSVSVSYGSGSFSGTEYIDTVTLGSDLVISKQSIGVSDTATGFNGVDGILGIGPVDLTQGTLSPDSSATIPTVTDNAFSQKLIKANSISVSFQPAKSVGDVNGQLSWGEDDTSKFTGSIDYAPKTTTSPASRYWGVDQSISYGDTTILSDKAGIVDTGTTLVLIASDAFQQYQSLTGGTLDQATGLLTITTSQYSNLKPLNFNIHGKTYGLTPNAQIFPRSLNSAIGGSADKIYLIVGDLGSSSGSGLDFINGYAFLERFYTVYDTANNQIGFATTSFTDAETN